MQSVEAPAHVTSVYNPFATQREKPRVFPEYYKNLHQFTHYHEIMRFVNLCMPSKLQFLWDMSDNFPTAHFDHTWNIAISHSKRIDNGYIEILHDDAEGVWKLHVQDSVHYRDYQLFPFQSPRQLVGIIKALGILPSDVKESDFQ